MIRFIEDKEEKKRLSREVLEALKEWFEVDESREQYIAECKDWLSWRVRKKIHIAAFCALRRPVMLL